MIKINDPYKAQKQANKILSGEGVTNERNGSSKEADLPVKADKYLATNDYIPVTPEIIKKSVGTKITSEVADVLAEQINIACMDKPEISRQYFKENFIGFLGVFEDSKKNTPKEYISASKFITFKQMGDDNTTAYTKTFPDRVRRMEQENVPNSYLHRYASAYSKTNLVVKMQAQMLMPAYILHQDIFNKAVETQCNIMEDETVSPKVRSDAANSLMSHLKPEIVKQSAVSIDIKANSAIDTFTKAMDDFVKNSRTKIINGDASIVDLSNSELFKNNFSDADVIEGSYHESS